MALEFPNTIEAAGLFTPFAQIPEQSIMSAQGFQPFDPAGTPLLPAGGYTHMAVGSYLLKLMVGIDFLEGLVLALAPVAFSEDEGGDPIFGPGPFMDGTLIPVSPAVAPTVPAGTQDFKSVAIVSVNDAGALVDSAFQVVIMRHTTGPRFADL